MLPAHYVWACISAFLSGQQKKFRPTAFTLYIHLCKLLFLKHFIFVVIAINATTTKIGYFISSMATTCRQQGVKKRWTGLSKLFPAITLAAVLSAMS
jgi:uncharacterized membrane protein